MRKQPHREESTGTVRAVYMAVELGAKWWHLAFGVGLQSAVSRRRVAAGDRAALRAAIGRARQRWALAPTAPVRSCYEAGRDGFWVHRLLVAEGVNNLVVDSSSIEVPRRARRAKTDRLDAEKLLRMLVRHHLGERDLWRVVRVPSVDVEDARHGERAIRTLVAERTRWRNRVRGLLALHGARARLTPAFAVAQVRDWAGQPLPPGVQARIAGASVHLGQVQEALRAARRQRQAAVRARASVAAERAARLRQLRGVGPETAMLLATEVFSRDLQTRQQVGALSGLVAVPYQSGAAARDQGISRAGLRRVRGVLVELAWTWMQWQPHSELTQWFERRFAHGGPRARKIGAVAVARKLLIALWHYSEHGVVPAGAVVDPAR